MEPELSVMVFYLRPRGRHVPHELVCPPAARRPNAAVKSRSMKNPAAPRPEDDPRPRPCLTWGRRRS